MQQTRKPYPVVFRSRLHFRFHFWSSAPGATVKGSGFMEPYQAANSPGCFKEAVPVCNFFCLKSATAWFLFQRMLSF